MAYHFLKLNKKYFQDVKDEIKTFEIRFNDRNFKKNDILVLRCWCPDLLIYTGKFIEREIIYISDFEQKPNYLVLGLR